MVKLLLLQDESELNEELATFLKAQGHQVTQVDDIDTCRRLLAATPEQCEIAIIDRSLSDGDGLDLVAELRSPPLSKPDRGIIILTAGGDSADKIDGFTRGADHYLNKPVRLPELAAVIVALARRLPPVGGWRLSVAMRSLLTPDGHQIALTTLEFSLIKIIAQAAGQTVSRKKIVLAFGEDYLTYDQNRLDTMVRRLRKKVENETGLRLPLHTVRVVGFVFSDLLIIQA